MDSDFRVDMGEIFKSLDAADVVAMYFPLLRKTLLLDRRRDPVEGPLVKVVPMAGSIEDRFRALKELRPGLPVPQSLAVIPWPKYVVSLRRLGIWDCILERFRREGQPQALDACAQAYKELSTLEWIEVRQAIAGQQYRSLWQSRR
ncbi:MAG: hypothetical protein HY676_02025 [Chloroflexi bacterium]|nr:hypothetical protein [Chloroflexota bacterium]